MTECSQTNTPYKPDERNQEPFTEASITKEAIRQCLQSKTSIKNHHIVYEDYRDVWQELAKETGDYAIPLLIEGGVLYENTSYDWVNKTGGIQFRAFCDPTINDASIFTDEQRKTFGIEKKDKLITLIHSKISWQRVSVVENDTKRLSSLVYVVRNKAGGRPHPAHGPRHAPPGAYTRASRWGRPRWPRMLGQTTTRSTATCPALALFTGEAGQGVACRPPAQRCRGGLPGARAFSHVAPRA